MYRRPVESCSRSIQCAARRRDQCTAMPAWEKVLKEEEMWDAILFLYDSTGLRPRAKEEGAKK